MRRLFVLCSALLVASCAMQMDLPTGFLRLKARESGDVRAVTAGDARIWVRDFAVDEGASLNFWITALRADLEQARGYRLVPKDVPFVDAAGHKGCLIEGTIAVGGEVHGYLVSVLQLDGKHLRIAEFSAREAEFLVHVEAVRTAVTTIQ